MKKSIVSAAIFLALTVGGTAFADVYSETESPDLNTPPSALAAPSNTAMPQPVTTDMSAHRDIAAQQTSANVMFRPASVPDAPASEMNTAPETESFAIRLPE